MEGVEEEQLDNDEYPKQSELTEMRCLRIQNIWCERETREKFHRKLMSENHVEWDRKTN